MKILVVNGGSSSFKFSLFETPCSLGFNAEPIWKKTVEFKNTGDDRKAAIKEALLEVPPDRSHRSSDCARWQSFSQAHPYYL
jgi:acetate kinase